MGSSEKFLCLILWIVAFGFVADAAQNQGKVLSEEENLELERQLEAINKPAIRSFSLAFDHPSLKNHTVQMRPESIPIWITNNNASQEGKSLQFLPDDMECPDGTVIIKRATKQDLMSTQLLKSLGFNYPGNVALKRNETNPAGHHFAVVQTTSIFFGAKGHISVWDPAVSADQFSLSSMWVLRSRKDQLNSIQAGLQVNRFLYADHDRLYTSWTVDPYYKTGCFNVLCPGFVQVSKRIPLGAIVRPVSTYNGSQFQIPVSIYNDLKTGHWWFVLNDNDYIGYWPKSLFPDKGLSSGATVVSWGGEVYSPVSVKSPPMGSGHFAGEGYGKSAYVNGLKVIDHSRKVVNPPKWIVLVYADNPKCYNAKYTTGRSDPWARAVFFGGPGGCTS